MNQEEQAIGRAGTDYRESKKLLGEIENQINDLLAKARHIIKWIDGGEAHYQEVEKTFGHGPGGNVSIIRDSTPWPSGDELGELVTKRRKAKERLTKAKEQLQKAGLTVS